MNVTRSSILGLFFLFPFAALAQMVVGADTLTGQEWIRHGQPYVKFHVREDGVYRLYGASLIAAGLDAGALSGGSIRLYSLGREIPVHVSTDGPFSAIDYVEFYGLRNRGEMDRHLYLRPDEDMLNPDHSLYTDDRPYFLTLDPSGSPLRVIDVGIVAGNPADHAMHRSTVSFSNALNDPYFPLSGGGAISYSSYMHAEGFAKNIENNSSTTVPAPGLAPAGPDGTLRIRFATSNYGTHRYVVAWNGTTLDTLRLQNLTFVDTAYVVPHGSIGASNQLTLTSLNTQSRHALVRVELTYARALDMTGANAFTWRVSAHAEATSWTLNGFLHSDVPPVVYSADGRYRSKAAIVGPDQVRIDWPDVSGESELTVVNAVTGIRPAENLVRVTFTDLSADNTDFIVITHPAIMAAGTESAYVQYRRSAQGGAYNAKAYSILDLYDLFGYGIQKHPQAIRNFVEFVSRHWPSAKMFFIVGRGIEYNRSRNPGESWESSFFVPTFGRPGADQLLMATVWDLIPRYPVGRLAVTAPSGVADYLDKVMAHDIALQTGQSLDEKRWIKNVMHIGGGKTSSEQNDFEQTLLALEEQIESSDYGGNVSFFQKTSTDIIGESQSAQILDLLQEGCGLINYLGHSGSSTFEFNISEPAEWNNTGRYPVFSAMGCSAGQIHGPLFSLSDNYVQIPDEGAIGFISGSGSQYAAALYEWAQPWYEHIGNIGYGAPLGESILHGLRALDKYVDPQQTNSNQYRFLLEQQTFQGDPAIRLHPLPGPDFLPDRRAVSIEPGTLSTDLDSFTLAFSIFNIGRNTGEQIAYTVSLRQ